MTSQDVACDFLREQLLDAALAPGQRLIAQDLAAKLGMSRTPVREAFGRLEQEQLITRDQAGGYIVRAFKVREIVDLYKVREALEVEAAVESMPHIDERTVLDLRSTLKAAQKEIDRQHPRGFLLASRKFHALIAARSGNALLQDLLAKINDKVQMIGMAMFRQVPSSMDEVMAENSAILDAIASGATADVVEAFRRHIRNGKERILRIVGGGVYG